MEGFAVDHDRCTRCGLCIDICSRKALSSDDEGGPALTAEGLQLCNACGHCTAICPVDAITPPKCNGERAMELPAVPDIDFAQAKRFILSNRSMRKYKRNPVPREEILELLEVARKAPSASNMQTLRWLVMSDRKKLDTFTALNMEWFDKMARNDPAMAARYNVDRLMARYKNGEDVILRGAPNAVLVITDKNVPWALTDAAVALTYFILAAHSRNIGSAWCGFGLRAMEAYPPMREFMGLDDSSVVQAMAFFGYPDASYRAVPPRKPLNVTWV